jgi:AraC-like DNA-binding protein
MISTYGVILLSPILISFVFIVLLIVKLKEKHDLSWSLLLSFMVLVFILSVTIIIRESDNYGLFRYLNSLHVSLMLVIHPLFYLYIYSMTTGKIKRIDYLIHHMPAIIIFALISFFHLLLNKDEVLAYLTGYMKGAPSESFLIKILYVTFWTSKITHAGQVVFYFVLVYRLLRKHQVEINNLFSATEKYKLGWLSSFIYVYFLMSVIGALSNILPTNIVYTTHTYIGITMIFFALFTLYIGVNGLDQKSISKLIKINDQNIPETKLPDLSKDILLHKIKNYIIDNEAFLISDLKIWDIVKHTGINRSYISQIINSEFEMSFNNYINKLRIEKACQILHENGNLSIETIAFKCGFNSITTFNRAFKKFTNQLPSNY